MKIITSSQLMRNELKKLTQARVAVAYIGKGWSKYMNSRQISTIVVSPTLGTNPDAIFELAAEIGWENVHFLDQLHAKVYLGGTFALLGSANLSINAFSLVMPVARRQ